MAGSSICTMKPASAMARYSSRIASASAIRSFARDLRLFSGTLAGHDRDLRRVIANGSVTATELRTFLDDNKVHLAGLINNLVTTGDIVVKHLPGLRQDLRRVLGRE